jgi:hypothetical protein
MNWWDHRIAQVTPAFALVIAVFAVLIVFGSHIH